MYINKAAI